MKLRIETEGLKMEFEGESNEFNGFLSSIIPNSILNTVDSMMNTVGIQSNKLEKVIEQVPASGTVRYQGAKTDWRQVFGFKNKLTKSEIQQNVKDIYNTSSGATYQRIKQAIDSGKLTLTKGGQYQINV